MKLFSFLRSIGNHRSNRARASKRASAKLALEGLEDRFLPSANVISGYVFNDANNDGLFEPGESPLANSAIQLRNAANLVVGATVTDANGFYQFSIDNTISTAPTTLSRTANLANTATDWTKAVNLQQFDPTLGTLLSVDIMNAGSFVSDIKVESLDNAPSTITATDAGSLTLSGPGLASLLTTDSTSKSFSASAFDGIVDFAGTSGTDFGAQTANGANSFTVTSAADLASFTGTGSLSFTEVAHATSSAAGAGNLISQISTTASAQVTVVYHYIPNNSLKPGSYIITQTSQPPNLLEGLESSSGVVIANSVGSDSIPVALGNGSSTNNDFAEISPASLSGYVYYDVNDNGVRDGGDQPIAGTTITLTGSNDLGTPVSLTTTTAADGSYQFTNLRPGTYTLTETQPPNYLQDKNTLGSLGGTQGNDQFSGIVVAPAAAGSNYDFGELLPASLSGYVYSDVNDNGLRDSGDQPIAGTTITLTGSNDLGTAVNLTTTTAADGSYQFSNLRPGTYTLSETQPAGYLQGKNNLGSLGGTAGNDQFSGIIVTPAATGSNYNFGEVLPASLSGYVYSDVNDNGVRDGGDQPIAGTTITLTGSNDLGTPVNLTTTTAADGSYQFTNLRPGTYTLAETQPTGYLQGVNNLGSLGGTAGNDLFSGIIAAPAATGSNYNFGEVLPASLSGYVYSDANDNGLRDSGDQPIAGTTITLTGSNDLGTPVNLTTTTGADGSYQFTNLRPGTYTLTETQPAGYLQGVNNLGSLGGAAGNDLFSGIIATPAAAGSNYNFGEVLPASLSGYVYSDPNDNGLRDSGDQPIAGTTITLTGSNDLGSPVNLTTTTGADGSYQFTNLRPGTYTLTETQPAGYLQGKNNLGALGGTAGNDQFSGIIVTPAAAGSNYNFGEVLPASLSGYVYSDLNDNGLRDSGDQPIAGTTITLTGSNDLGAPVNLTTMTAADGSYQFSNLRPGTYTLTETQPAGYLQGKNNLGSLGGAAGNDLFSGIIAIAAATGSNYNFGEVLPASLSGYVYSDVNDNGLRDGGDQPIAGTTITLTGSNDLGIPVNLTTTTAADGSYQFSNLRPGTYTL
ncbi:MAG TPA: SdrD B-like domain-containing protein, partial [Gemmataceae bacterium]|nr:SdrD B-like domain-containing protein [Gemmataceae bacterium]